MAFSLRPRRVRRPGKIPPMAEATHVRTEVVGGVLVATLTTNSLSDYESRVVADEIQKEAPKGLWRVILDFAEVQFMASAGIGMILTLVHQAKAQKGRVVVCNLSPEIHQVLKMTKVDKLFTITPTVQEAKSKIGA